MASSITVNIKLSKGLQNIDKNVDRAVSTALDKIADSIIQGAQSVVPVRTGRLRDSIGVKEKTDRSLTVAADTEYAAAIEFGTGSRPAQPYLLPQSDRMQTEGPKILGEEIEKAIK